MLPHKLILLAGKRAFGFVYDIPKTIMKREKAEDYRHKRLYAEYVSNEKTAAMGAVRNS